MIGATAPAIPDAMRNGTSPISFHALGDFASLSYEAYAANDGTKVCKRLPEGWTYNNLGFETDDQGYIHNGLGGEAYVAENSSTGEVALVFTGTDQPGDWFFDLTILTETIDLALGAFYPLIKAVERHASDLGYKLAVTGHSLGGAMAEYLYATRSAFDEGAGIGSPGVGLFNFDNSFVHVTREQDLIGRGFFILNSHIGPTFEINDDNKAYGVGGEAHFASNYASEMQEISHSSIGSTLFEDSHVYFFGDEKAEADLHTMAGYDAYFGGNYDDIVFIGSGLSGNIDGGCGDDVISGDAFSDNLAGGDGNDLLLGFGGTDYLSGDSGNDRLEGGAGGDHYSIGVGPWSDIVDDRGGDGIDTVAVYTGDIFNSINFSWFSVDGNDLLVRAQDSHGSLVLDIRIVGMGSNAGAIEHFDLYAGDGTNLTQSWDLTQVWAELTEQSAPDEPDQPAPPHIDQGDFTWIGTGGADTQAFGSGDDVAAGLGGDDALGGGNGDDIILGGTGSDVLNGGANDDILVDDDSSSSLGGDYLDGGEGDDQIVFYGASSGKQDRGFGGSGNDLALVVLQDRSSDWHMSISGNTVNVRPENANLEGTVSLQQFETVAVLFGSGDDFAHGGSERDYLDGGNGSDSLDGDIGNDVLIGGNGDDRLYSGSGTDWIDGGTGHDFAEIDLSASTANLTFLEDKAQSEEGFTFENGTYVRNVEEFDVRTGSGNDYLWFGSGDFQAATNGGNDVFVTTGHADEVLDGGTGDDFVTADYSWAITALRSQFNSSTSAFWIYLGGQQVSATDKVVSVNVERFSIQGGSANDDIIGYTGDDVLVGNGGDDNLDGKLGNDTMKGGDGDDFLVAGGGVDWIDGGGGSDTVKIDRNSGDLVYDGTRAATAAGFTLADGTFISNVETAFIYFLSSGNLTATFTGHGRNFALLSGGTNKIAVDYSWSSVGITSVYDSSQYSWFAYSGSDANNDSVQAYLVGFSGISVQVNVVGSAFHDDLRGYILNDVLAGGGGNDRLAGSDGDDILQGGTGKDILFGGTGNDVLSGGVGNDKLYGASGSDTADYTFASGGVTVNLSIATAQTVGGGEGIDTLASIENLIGSNFADVLIGNSSKNSLTGNAGDDHLDGAAGDDVLVGGLSGDLLIGGTGHDILVYDSVLDSTSKDYDTIQGFDFRGIDHFDLPVTVTAMDTMVASGALSTDTFDEDLAQAIGAAQLRSHHAILFTPNSGSLAGTIFLIVDANHEAGYQAGEDFVFLLSGSQNLSFLNAADFI